ncbi:MAG: peptidoglycan editing factor PgeF [Candidatus Omnitrophota bacterium]
MNNPVLGAENRPHLFENLFPHSIFLKYSSGQDGTMSFVHGSGSNVSENRRSFLEDSGVDAARLVCARQVHGDTVACVSDADAGRGADSPESAFADTDALITDRRRLALAIFTADCLPVFLYDPQKQVIGLAHAGWRGTKENIAGKTVQAMMKQYDCRPGDIYAGFGPAIRGCCYRVGDEFKDRFESGLAQKNGSLYLDLVKINTEQLLRREIKRVNIFDSSICTFCANDGYFSYRRQGLSSGRGMAVLMIR